MGSVMRFLNQTARGGSERGRNRSLSSARLLHTTHSTHAPHSSTAVLDEPVDVVSVQWWKLQTHSCWCMRSGEGRQRRERRRAKRRKRGIFSADLTLRGRQRNSLSPLVACPCSFPHLHNSHTYNEHFTGTIQQRTHESGVGHVRFAVRCAHAPSCSLLSLRFSPLPQDGDFGCLHPP